MERRDFLVGSAAITASTLCPNVIQTAQANPFLWLLRFIFRSGLRRSFRRSGRGSAPAVYQNSVRSSRQVALTGEQSSYRIIRTGKGDLRVRNSDDPALRNAILRRLVSEIGKELINPKEVGINTPDMIGITPERAEQIKQNQPDAIWITDEVNSAYVEVRNQDDVSFKDALKIELWSEHLRGAPIDEKVRIVRAQPNAAAEIGPFQYRNVPKGLMEIKALATNHPGLVSDQSVSRIVGVAADEVVRFV